MNIAALAQSQTLATLLQALAPATTLAAGRTVEARLVSIAADGTATATIDGTPVSLVLAGPQARAAALQPGATLMLRIDAAQTPDAAPRASLVEIRSPGSPPSAPPVAQQASAAPALAAAGTALRTPQTQAAPAGQPPAAVPLVSEATAAQPAMRVDLRPQTGELAPQRQDPRMPQAQAGEAGPTPPPRSTAGPLLATALSRQDGLAPLFANLKALASGSIALTLPSPMLPLIDKVLAQALPVEHRALNAAALQQAVRNSGVFHEARQLAEGAAQPGRPAPQIPDLKGSLQALRDGLLPLLDTLTARPATRAAPVETQGNPGPERPAPPRRDGMPTPQPATQPTLPVGASPQAVTETLIGQTQAALDRLELGQYASLPPDVVRPDQAQGQAPRWHVEIPLLLHSGVAVLPLQIEKEPPRREVEGVSGPLWRIRFALDVEPMGPLQGVVTLQGRSVGVTLWAEREETSRLLRGAAPGLEHALADARLENGAIDIHTGRPRVAQPTAGQFLDRMS